MLQVVFPKDYEKTILFGGGGEGVGGERGRLLTVFTIRVGAYSNKYSIPSFLLGNSLGPSPLTIARQRDSPE